MPTTLNFGPVSLNPGTQTFGPANLADTDNQLTLAINRAPAGGFNDIPAASAKISFEQSNDAGTTWDELCSATIIGGQVLKNGVLRTVSSVSTQLWPGSGRLGRGVVTISGSSVVVQGSLAIT